MRVGARPHGQSPGSRRSQRPRHCVGAHLAIHQQVMTRWDPWLSRVRRALAGRPRALSAAIIVLAVVIVTTISALAWFAVGITADLPDGHAVRDLGDMAQATTIFDAADNPVFTIFKEQRIEVPLEKMSPNLIKAVIS